MGTDDDVVSDEAIDLSGFILFPSLLFLCLPLLFLCLLLLFLCPSLLFLLPTARFGFLRGFGLSFSLLPLDLSGFSVRFGLLPPPFSRFPFLPLSQDLLLSLPFLRRLTLSSFTTQPFLAGNPSLLGNAGLFGCSFFIPPPLLFSSLSCSDRLSLAPLLFLLLVALLQELDEEIPPLTFRFAATLPLLPLSGVLFTHHAIEPRPHFCVLVAGLWEGSWELVTLQDHALKELGELEHRSRAEGLGLHHVRVRLGHDDCAINIDPAPLVHRR
ncbi:uncharacterized protein EI97DRAFT_227786 [Westerdykella ornata]|uniref:Uncharacterized protein n=1 Tax=Westerdykella ornata TaxID=318751 RepID=A0A6A6JRV3_WESOR|nr:uncharacterized protein EI97DRAFT_227786 [Westerdykella ornata]KAF2279117.1 hypothetical protein EI97DRAFT_227786 [Westerdykella ornata]